MCGITGFFLSDLNKKNDFFLKEIKKMNDILFHRGPDNGDLWFDRADKIYLGHRRLSVIDLSEKAHQPMKSNNERFVISFNGEIYNFKDLKKDLKEKKLNFIIIWILKFYLRF